MAEQLTFREELDVVDRFTWQSPETGQFFEVNVMSDGTQDVVSLKSNWKDKVN